MSKRIKPKKDSLIELTRKYSNDHHACIQFFFDMKWPTGFYCEKCGCNHYYTIKRNNVFKCKECGHEHYLLAGTIFQDNKLELYKLIIGLYIIFTANKGIASTELASMLDVNYKTSLLLNRKCRILMAQSGSEKILDSLFYEADGVYIGAKSKESHKQGCATEQQPCLFILSTDKDNSYPKYIKLHLIKSESSENIERAILSNIRLSLDKTLNTDGKFSYDILKDKIQVNNKKINYSEKGHRLYWLNIIVGDIKNNISGIYHGISKRDMPLFIKEQEWRFNHRYVGCHIMNKVKKYILQSHPSPKRHIIYILNISKSFFSTCI